MSDASVPTLRVRNCAGPLDGHDQCQSYLLHPSNLQPKAGRGLTISTIPRYQTR